MREVPSSGFRCLSAPSLLHKQPGHPPSSRGPGSEPGLDQVVSGEEDWKGPPPPAQVPQGGAQDSLLGSPLGQRAGQLRRQAGTEGQHRNGSRRGARVRRAPGGGLQSWRQKVPLNPAWRQGGPPPSQPQGASWLCHSGLSHSSPSPDRSNLKLRMVGGGEHRGTRVPAFPWSLPLAGFHLHTRWISNSFTSVSYQTGGSTFLR